MAIDYEDFVLSFDPEPGGVLRVRAASPAGEAEAKTRWSDGELGPEIFAGVGSWWRSRLPGRHLALDVPVPSSADLTAEQVGQDLFDFAFQGQIRVLFDQSLGLTRALYRGLRIVLRFPGESAAGGWLSRLPWELLHRPEAGGFLGLDPSTSIVRHLDLSQPVVMAPLEDVPRVLITFSDAADLPGPRRKGGSPRARKGSRQLRDRDSVHGFGSR